MSIENSFEEHKDKALSQVAVMRRFYLKTIKLI